MPATKHYFVTVVETVTTTKIVQIEVNDERRKGWGINAGNDDADEFLSDSISDAAVETLSKIRDNRESFYGEFKESVYAATGAVAVETPKLPAAICTSYQATMATEATTGQAVGRFSKVV